MIYRFGDIELDTAKAEIRSGGSAVAVEPQVLAILTLLIEQRDRLVSKDELIESIWQGRIVSDAAIASRIRSARQAVGDDGHTQKLIKTVHGLGFRFIAEVLEESAAPRIDVRPPELPELKIEMEAEPISRPSIAVLPFRQIGQPGAMAGIAEALPDDLITELSRLRWLFIIARGSSFQFRDGAAEIGHVRAALGVRYCLSGAVETLGSSLTVSVELSDAETKGVIWGDRFRGDVGSVHEIREQIVRAVTGAMELQIPLNEARRARLQSPEHLDAWSAYHLGLSHMYRFNKEDNAIAIGLFQRAAGLEPGFARAYAGLSFTHFQNAFLRYSDVTEATKLTQAYAEQSLEHDPLDPFGNFTMGRSQMLRGDLEGSLAWLERANTLSPNYAQAKYSKAWTEAMLGSICASQSDVDAALALSPLDPLRYAMLAVRGFSHMSLGEHTKAAEWSEKAARSPGAHVLIDMVASVAHGLNGDAANAENWAKSAKAKDASLSTERFLHAFPFRDAPLRADIVKTLGRLGF